MESGLQLNRNRYLHLELGRWLSRDPKKQKTQLINLFLYVNDRPIYFLDPAGLQVVLGNQEVIRPIPGIPSIIEGTILEDPPYYYVPTPVIEVPGNCKLRVCNNPIGKPPLSIGSHVSIFLDGDFNGRPSSWGYEGMPGGDDPRAQDPACANKMKPLGSFGWLWAIGYEVPPEHQDAGELNPERCKEIELGQACDITHNCFAAVIKRIRRCCIAYNPTPTPLLTGGGTGIIGGCNSNCVASWLLTSCVANPPALPVIKPGQGLPVGWGMPQPKCVEDRREPPVNDPPC